MKKSMFLLFIIIHFLGMSQENKYKITAYQFMLERSYLRHGNQPWIQFMGTVENPDQYDVQDSSLMMQEGFLWSDYITYTAEISVGKTDSKWSQKYGVSYYQRNERDYYGSSWKSTVIDTVYVPVPDFNYNQQGNSQTEYFVNYDSLLLDSINYNYHHIYSHSNNIEFHGEMLFSLKKNKYTFSIGGGLAFGMSITNKVYSKYEKSWALRMGRDKFDGDVSAVWYADIPKFNPTQGALYPLSPSTYQQQIASGTGNLIVNVRPYVPLRIEAQIAEEGFFSHLSVCVAAKAGLEMQFIKNGGIKPRFIHSYQAGLKYNI